MLRHALEAQGHTVIEARDQPEAVQALAVGAPWRRAVRSAPARRRRFRRAARREGARSRAAGHRHDGVRQHSGRRGRDEGRRARLSRQAGRSRSSAADRRARARRSGGWPPRTSCSRKSSPQRRGAPQIVGEDAQAEAGDRSRCTARPPPTRPCCSRARAARARSCSRARCTRSARAPTVRSSPSTARRFPRTCSRPSCSATRRARSPAPPQPQARQVRARAPRHAVSRRDRRAAARAAGEDPARARGEDGSSASAAPRRCRSTSAWSPRRTGTCKAAVAARQFREDLFFRLSVFPITIPPLRERPDDIPMLAKYFIERFCRDLNKKPLALAPSAVEELRAYRWPGNVRELQNCIERAVILTEGDTIHARHLNLSFRNAGADASRVDDEPVGAHRSVGHAGRRVATRVVAKSSDGRSSRRSRKRRQPRPRRRGSAGQLTRRSSRSCVSSAWNKPHQSRRSLRLKPHLLQRRLHFLLRHIIDDRRRADRGRQHEVQACRRRPSCRAASASSIWAVERSAIGGKRPEAGDEIGERLAIAVGERAARGAQSRAATSMPYATASPWRNRRYFVTASSAWPAVWPKFRIRRGPDSFSSAATTAALIRHDSAMIGVRTPDPRGEDRRCARGRSDRRATGSTSSRT